MRFARIIYKISLLWQFWLRATAARLRDCFASSNWAIAPGVRSPTLST
ncbi:MULTISPECIES: hypothetical protein [unclassified Microcoleus]